MVADGSHGKSNYSWVETIRHLRYGSQTMRRPRRVLLKKAAQVMGRKGGLKGGRSRSPAKIAAARANGAKGGRPKKSSPDGNIS
jgi:hypothetical protein